MSGGSYSYIQYKDATEFLEDSRLVEEVEHMATALKTEYGEEGAAASAATEKFHKRLLEVREQIQALTKELDDYISPLKNVWRQVDYHGSMNVSKESVIVELVKYNAPKPC